MPASFAAQAVFTVMPTWPIRSGHVNMWAGARLALTGDPDALLREFNEKHNPEARLMFISSDELQPRYNYGYQFYKWILKFLCLAVIVLISLMCLDNGTARDPRNFVTSDTVLHISGLTSTSPQRSMQHGADLKVLVNRQFKESGANTTIDVQQSSAYDECSSSCEDIGTNHTRGASSSFCKTELTVLNFSRGDVLKMCWKRQAGSMWLEVISGYMTKVVEKTFPKDNGLHFRRGDVLTTCWKRQAKGMCRAVNIALPDHGWRYHMPEVVEKMFPKNGCLTIKEREIYKCGTATITFDAAGLLDMTVAVKAIDVPRVTAQWLMVNRSGSAQRAWKHAASRHLNAGVILNDASEMSGQRVRQYLYALISGGQDDGQEGDAPECVLAHCELSPMQRLV